MLKTIYTTATAGLFLVLATGAAADPWKDESGNGHQGYESYYEAKEGKIVRYENGCKIEEKFDGGYKKEVKCDGRTARIGSGLPHSYGPPVNLLPEETPKLRSAFRRVAIFLIALAATRPHRLDPAADRSQTRR